MLGKIIKLLLLVNILFAGVAFGQANKRPGNKSITAQYNSWLKLTNLSRLFEAESFKQNAQNQQAPTGNSTYVLTLKPAKSFTDVKAFALSFNNTRAKLKRMDVDIYALLFNKLTDYSFLPPDSLSLRVETNDAHVFALTIDYNQQLEHEETLLLERGNNPPAEIELANAYVADKCFDTHSTPTIADMQRSLTTYFKTYYKTRAGDAKPEYLTNDHQNGFVCRLTNIDGIVTKTNLHEMIILNVKIDARGICYSLDVSYAGGMKAPDPDKTEFYHAAAIKFRAEYDVYEQKLQQALKNIFNGTKPN